MPRDSRTFAAGPVGSTGILGLLLLLFGSSCSNHESLPPLPVSQVSVDLLEVFLDHAPPADEAETLWASGPVAVSTSHPEAGLTVGELFVNIKKLVVKKGGNRPSLLAAPPSTVHFSQTIPPSGQLEFGAGVGLKTLPALTSDVTFKVMVENDVVFEHVFTAPTANGPKPDWVDPVIDLSAYAGKEVSLTFLIKMEGAETRPPLVAGWSQPRITTVEDVERKPSSVDRPNVMFVVVDTLRADHLGCQGYPRPTSPNLDLWAESSAVYERAISQSSWTWPATATLLTGLYPYTHGVTKAEQCFLSEKLVSAAEIFQGKGFRTLGVSANPLICEAQNFDQGFEELVEVFHEPAEVLTDRAITFLEECGNEPFFLYLHYMDPHYPYAPPPEDLAPFREERTTAEDDRIYKAIAEAPNQVAVQRFKDHAQHLTDLYDGEIRHFDLEFARLLRSLREKGLDEKTLIVLTSDHGEEIFEHGRVGHARTLYEEVLHVPLILHFPAKVKPGRHPGLVETISILPTILHLAGIEEKGAFQGRMLSRPGFHFDDRSAFAATAMGHPGGHGFYMNQNSIRRGGWKLIYLPTSGKTELYDVGKDPGETNEISAEKPAVVEELWTELSEWMKTTRADHRNRTVSMSTQDKLEELGYVDVPELEKPDEPPPTPEQKKDLSWDGKTFVHPVTKEKTGGEG